MSPNSAKRPSSNTRGVSPPPAKRKQQSTTTSKAVSNFFKPASQKEPEKMSWRIVNNSLLIGRHGAAAPITRTAGGKGQKIAAFDFDSTIIMPSSGKKFAKDASDWKWWDSSVPGKLRSLHDEGYLITILSNQGGISLKPDPKTIKSDQKRLADFKSKASTVLTQLDLPISLYAATSRDRYRKPRTGMWHELLDDYDLESTTGNAADAAVDLENSFFVGDAGGREAVPGTGEKGAGGVVKDHSCGDRDFAANVGIAFHTPEEYFLQQDVRPFVREFDPTVFLQGTGTGSTSAAANPTSFEKKNPVDIVLFVGSPGAGKSSFYWRYLQPLGYGRVNQDILKTREKCLQSATALIKEGTSVAVDNTNADPDTRAHWTALAKKLDVPIRCVLFTAPAKLCEHNDTVRALNLGPETNPESRSILPKLAFTGFASRFREPKQLEEGFQDIVRVDFMFEGNDEVKKLWSQFWI